ncbi:hypothetical protein HELRODRAFT_106317 [Helobdella robusta]|uniref:EGF-like domain-containing protein n=1 Tax=Helobdella robusta TaxID=6412 RepID=T1EE19_HELRO|nr:hypothetical protein HELRODRAFT_106317 [Helobdella robusta]ESO06724.1 hypothetical protein HELRODRAFT_106317 [Helobdella robusta]
MGYEVHDGVCIDIDECNQTSPCDSTSSNCINMNGTYECVCKDGYQKDKSTGICLACQDGMYGKNCSKLCQCSPAMCNKTTGCQSPCENSGFTGADCDENVNECQINGICGAANCNDTHGSYYCYCPQWFQLMGSNTNIKCSVIDACQYNVTDGGTQLVNGTCVNNGVCKNGTNLAAPGTFACECAPGFDGKFCEHDIDECLSNNCDLKTQHCVDQINGFYCACNPGVSGPGCNFFGTVVFYLVVIFHLIVTSLYFLGTVFTSRCR